jgi:hypothetical protein
VNHRGTPVKSCFAGPDCRHLTGQAEGTERRRKEKNHRGTEDTEDSTEREDFVFAAETPAKTKRLACGAYQVRLNPCGEAASQRFAAKSLSVPQWFNPLREGGKDKAPRLRRFRKLIQKRCLVEE